MATPPAPAPVRLRLLFDNPHLLRRSQRKEGLRRCWLLLRPELATVADLAAHVTACFRLRQSCPRGVVFLMDGFSLPPFESTCILRDMDTIRVKKKACKKAVRHNDVHCIRDPEVVEKRPLPIGDEILGIEYQVDYSKHQKEEVQSDHRHEENATANHNLENEDTGSKRKCGGGDLEIPESSKRKKLKVTNPGKHIGCSKEDSVHQDRDQCSSRKLKLSSVDIEAKKVAIQAEATVTLEEEQKTDKRNRTELNCEAELADHNVQSDTKKVTSRSARRKKIKRQLRQKANEQLKETLQSQESPMTANCLLASNRDGFPCPSSNPNDLHLPISSHEADEEESDTSDDVVPVVVRPGHIRFEPAGGEPNTSRAKEIQATLQWSGNMSKKKGQKWGMNYTNKRQADTSYHGIITGSNTEVNHHVLDKKTAENGFCGASNEKVGESSHDVSASEKTLAEEGRSSSEHLDFESLYPLTRLPKEGDLIVYRLVELSSSWCPEISSYRVGEVLMYDLISMRIILLPVKEYPIITEEKNGKDESDMLVGMSPYDEEGSLEIEYSSLLDVRLLKGNESVPAAVTVSTPLRETGKKGGSLVTKPGTLDQNKGKTHIQTGPLVPNNSKVSEGAAPEKARNKVWEESDEAPNDKPEVQENGWGTWTPNPSTSAWSYRALRSSALGPTVAFLRGKNNKRGKPRPSNGKYSM